jgi:hypothetical protein
MKTAVPFAPALAGLLACLVFAPAWADPGDRTIAFTVPVTLSSLDPAVQTYSVECAVISPASQIVARARSAPVPAMNGGGQASVNVTVPAAAVQYGMSYGCSLFFNDKPVTDSPQAAVPAWDIVSPQSVLRVRDALRP